MHKKKRNILAIATAFIMALSVFACFQTEKVDVNAASKMSVAKTVKSVLKGSCDKNMVCAYIGAMDVQSGLSSTRKWGDQYGLMQWRTGRLKQLKKEKNYKTAKTQAKFTLKEAKRFKAIKKGGSLHDDCVVVVKKYLFFGNNKSVIKRTEERAKYWKKKLY